MIEKKVYIFIDEFGNAHLDLEKSGTFTHFVYTAFIITEDELQKAKDLRNKISSKYFQNSFIKSSSIGNDDKGFRKRLAIIKEIKQLNFILHSFVIDKSKIYSEGLSFKKSFYKYFNRLLIEKFPEKFHSFEIYLDKLGYPEFQLELTNYMDKYIQRNLFEQDRKFIIAEDKIEEPLIQFADFFSGCIGKIFCVSHLDLRANEIFELVNDRLFVNFFPYENNFIKGITYDKSNEIDFKILSIAMEIAIDYIKKSKNDNIEKKEVLQRLLISSQITPDRIVSTKELVSVVNNFSAKFTKDKLRIIIQDLRDEGILIASPQGEKGYKLPNTMVDVISFYNRLLSSIEPMLKRISISNRTIIEKSEFKIKIIESVVEFDKLQKLINVIESK